MTIKIGKYALQPFAPVRNVVAILTFKPHRVPFVVNTLGFEQYQQPGRFYIVEQDGIDGPWLAHDNYFTNVVESNAGVGKTPVEALMNYIHEGSE